MKNKHTKYILKDKNGKLHLYQYSPEQSYAGRSDRDQYALMQGVFITNPTHDLWLGSVKCIKSIGTPSGIQTFDYPCEIIAKTQYMWDMSKPMGIENRKSETKESKNWKYYFELYLNQSKLTSNDLK